MPRVCTLKRRFYPTPPAHPTRQCPSYLHPTYEHRTGLDMYTSSVVTDYCETESLVLVWAMTGIKKDIWIFEGGLLCVLMEPARILQAYL